MLSKLVIGLSRSHRQSEVKSGLYVEGYNCGSKSWLISLE